MVIIATYNTMKTRYYRSTSGMPYPVKTTTKTTLLVLVLLLLLGTVIEAVAAVVVVPDRSRWEWKLSDVYTGTLMMRPSPNHTWGTVCKDGMKGGAIVCSSLGLNDVYVEESLSRSFAVADTGFGGGGVWSITPGPSDAPIYLDDASCPPDATHLDNCSWAAGDATVLGAGTPGADCTHAEDIGFTCSPPTVDAMNYRLLPFEGLPPTAMTGSIEVQMSPDGPWQRLLVTKYATDYDVGMAAYLCIRMYPNRTFTRDQAQVVASGLASLSVEALSNPLNAFKIQSYYWAYDRVWYTSASTAQDTPADSLNITCEATVDVRLVNGPNELEGNAEIQFTIPHLHTSNYTSLCSSTQNNMAMSVCVTKFGTDYIGNSTISGGTVTYPFGTNVTPRGGYPLSYSRTDMYVSSYYSKEAITRLADWSVSSLRGGSSSTPCSYPMPVTCTPVQGTRWDYNFSSRMVSGLQISARVYARRVVEGSETEPWSQVCTSGWSAVTTRLFCNAMGMSENTRPGITLTGSTINTVNIRPNCSVSSFDNCVSTSSPCSSVNNLIYCTNTSPEAVEFDTPWTYNFRLADNITNSTSAEGVVEMQGSDATPWRTQCMSTTTIAYLATFASSVCRDMFPNRSFYGEEILLPSGYNVSSYSINVISCSSSRLIDGSVNITTICSFRKQSTTCAPIAVRCTLENASFRLFDADSTGRSGILQMRVSGKDWGRVQSITDNGAYTGIYPASIICEELGFTGAVGFATDFNTRNTSLGVVVSWFQTGYSIRLSPTSRWYDVGYHELYSLGSLTSDGYTRLTCNEPYNQSLMEMRLVEGSNAANGFVEARLNSNMQWARVCSETAYSKQTIQDATCRAAFGNRYVSYTEVSPPISRITSVRNQLNQFKCPERTNNLTTCFGLQTAEGDPSEGVTCSAISVQCIIADNRIVRLVNGTAPSNGMLQMYVPSGIGYWTTVCNEHFKADKRLWTAICDLAGYPTPANTTPLARYMLHPVSMWDALPITTVVSPSFSSLCQDALVRGNATDISLSCFPWTTSPSTCRHQEDVGLDCMPPTPTITLTPSVATPSHSQVTTGTASSPHSSTESSTHPTTSNSLTSSRLTTATSTIPHVPISYTPTTLVYCINSSWPPVGRACEMVQGGGCASSTSNPSSIVEFNRWYGGDKVYVFEVVIAHIIVINGDFLLGNTTALYRQMRPGVVALESTTSSNITAAVYVKHQPSNATGITLRIEMRRLLGPSDPSTGTIASVGLMLADTLDSGPFACILPNGGLPTDPKPTAKAMRSRGLYLPLATLLFDAPPPLADPGTRKAVAAAANAAAVASMAAGPIAADMQALAALGSMRCAPGGGDATGQNEEAVDDNMGALSIVALDNTCQGVLLGNFIVLGAGAVLNTIAAVAVFVVKRFRGHPHFPFLQAMALVRLPSLLFVGASALQMGFVVCGYQLMIGDGSGDAALGALGFVVAVVLLPVVPAVVSHTIMSRRRYCVDFPSFTLSAPSRRPKEGAVDSITTTPTKPSWLRSKLVALFLPSSTIDSEFHPLSVAFSTFASRNRLPHAVWSSLPYLTPLALLPPLVSPIQACLPLLVLSAILHLLLAAIMLIFRPHAILFSNFMGAAALLVNAMLVGCAAALTHDPGMELARTVLNSVGGLQMMVSVVRLLHVAVVSVALPAAMTLHMLQRPVRVSPPPTGTTLPNGAAKIEDDDVELLDITADSPTPTFKDVVPLWTVNAACAPQWPPIWASELDVDELGIGNNFIQDLLFAPDMNGPRPNHRGAYAPRSLSVSEVEDDINSDDDLLPTPPVDLVPEDDDPTPPTAVTPTPPASIPPSESEGEEEDESSDEINRLRQLRDPSLNPMALMDSTARVLSQRLVAKNIKKKNRRPAASSNHHTKTVKHLYYFADSTESSSSTLLDEDGEPLPHREGSPRRRW